MSLDVEIRAAERAGDEALVRRLRRRRGEGIQVGDRVKCVDAQVEVVAQLLGRVGCVAQVTEVKSVRVRFPGYRWEWLGRGGNEGGDPVNDGLPDLGWWLVVGEYELVED